MRIAFIEPKPPDYHIFTRMPLPRLGTVLLGSILKKEGYEVECYVETAAELDLERVLSADAVGISTITSTATRAYEIAKIMREAGRPVFMGGPHVSYMPDEALQYCDFAFRGEADEVIVDFVRALERGEGFESIPGLSFVKDGKVYHNQMPSFCKDLDVLPQPDFSIIKEYKNIGITPIMTSRGCPYDCSFCSVTGMFGRKYRFRSKESVLEELREHRANLRKKSHDWVFFYDDNFTASPARTKELLRAMIKEGLTPHWTAQARVEVARDKELLELMKASNCHTLYIGFESINPETLKLYNKRQSVRDIEEAIDILHSNGIRIHGMFVFGSDEDTRDTIHKTVKFAKRNNLDSIQFMILTPLPGTSLYNKLNGQNRIITKDWSLYDAHHVVFKPEKMSYYELQAETMKATAEFYSWGQIVKRMLKFDLFNVSIKTYGHNLTKKWIKRNREFVEFTWDITYRAGKKVELKARKTAEDIREKLHQIQSKRDSASSQSVVKGV